METPKDNLPDEPVPPKVVVNNGSLGAPALHTLEDAFSPKIHHLVSTEPSGSNPDQHFAATCSKMPLFDPRITQVKQLALWRRRPPKVASPRLPSKHVTVKSFTIPIIRTQLKRGRFRPVQVQLHEIAPLPLPCVSGNIDFSQHIPWSLLIHSLESFTAAKQSYYHWYSRERLNLDLADGHFQGICCYVPPLELELLSLKPHENARFQLSVRTSGTSRQELEGRHGLLFHDEQGLQLVRLPPP